MTTNKNRPWSIQPGEELTLNKIYDLLPMTERALLKRIKEGGRFYQLNFSLLNDTGHPCTYRVIRHGDGLTVGPNIGASKELGVIVYASGRKLCSHALVEAV